MRYHILKFEAVYGPPMYRVWVRKFPWGSWIKDPGGAVRNFDTKEEAHVHMRALAQARVAKPAAIDSPHRATA